MSKFDSAMKGRVASVMPCIAGRLACMEFPWCEWKGAMNGARRI